MRGGRRPGAGRPRKAGSGVPHQKRPAFDAKTPVHVALRVLSGAPPLREAVVRRALEAFPLRVDGVAVGSLRIDLIARAPSRQALGLAMRGLAIRVARATNKAAGRKGQLFQDRYHLRVLESAAELRAAKQWLAQAR